jgi:GAF domain-containing protein
LSQQELAREVASLQLLQQISTELIQEQSVKNLYERIADAAVAIMESDFASMQMLYPERGERGELLLLAYRGFTPEAARFWEWVPADSGSTCAVALRTRQRVIAPDVETCEFMAGTEDLATYRQTGIRSVQSTPLLSRSGQIVGMISTHWKQVHAPTERDLRVFDVLARQAADLVERRRTEEAALVKEQQLRALAAHLDEQIIKPKNVGRRQRKADPGIA